VGTAKLIGSIMNPKHAAEMATDIADVLKATGKVSEQMIEAKDFLSGIGPWWSDIQDWVDDMREGSNALKTIGPEVANYVGVVVGVAQSIGGNLDPSQAAEMATGIADVLKATGKVSEQMIEAKDFLSGVGPWHGDASSWAADMKKGVTAFDTIRDPIVNFAKSMKTTGDAISAAISGDDSAGMVQSMSIISVMIDEVTKVMAVLDEKMVPLTKKSFFGFGSSPAENLRAAIPDLKDLFTEVAKFVKTGIIEPVDTHLKDVDGLRETGRTISIMADVLDRTRVSIQAIAKVASIYSDGGFSTDSTAESITAGLKDKALPTLMKGIASFVADGIVDPIKDNLSDVDGLREAGRTIKIMAEVLDLTRTSIDSVASVAAIYSDGGWLAGSSTAEKISAGLQGNALPKLIGDIAKFVKTGIVVPINTSFKSIEELKKTGKTMKILACILCDTKTMLNSMVSVISLMDPKHWNELAPMEKIIEYKGQFKSWFIAIAAFIKSGIIEPVNKTFPDPSEVRMAGNTIGILTSVATSLPPLLKGMATAIGYAIKPGFFKSGDSTMEKILGAREDFEKWFLAIGEFMRDGIIKPTLKTFKNIDVAGAAKIMAAITSIAIAVPKLILALARAVGLMTSTDPRKEAPMALIVEGASKFQEWFIKVGIFVREGIINPIMDELGTIGENKILEAARILSAVGMVVKQIPPIIKYMAGELMNLIKKDVVAESPGELLISKKDDFSSWFRDVAIFIRDGIVDPILTELPEENLILEAARILSSIGMVVKQLPVVIKSLSKVFGKLDPEDCYKDAPMEELEKNIPKYKRQMFVMASFMREGIIQPIHDNFPNPEEVTAVSGLLTSMIQVVRMLPNFIMELSSVMGSLTLTMFGLVKSPAAKAYSKVAEFAMYFSGIAFFLGQGIIRPIMTSFPNNEEVVEAGDRLNGLLKVLRLLPTWLTALNEQMVVLTNSSWVNDDLSESVPAFANYFYGIASAIGEGIINPVRTMFASTDELPEIIGRIEGVKKIISSAGEMMSTLSEVLAPWVKPNKSFLWFSWGSEMEDTGGVADAFGDQFAGIASAINDGILGPVKDFFPPLAEVEATLATIEAITGIFKALDELLATLADVIGGMSGTKIDFSKLDNIDWAAIGGALSKLGGGVTAAAPSAPTITAPAAAAMDTPEASATSALTGAHKGRLKRRGAAAMLPTKEMTREDRIANYQRKSAASAAKYQARYGGGAEALGGTTAGAAATTATVSDKAIGKSIAKKAAGASQNLSTSMEEMSRAATSPGSIYTHDIHLEKAIITLSSSLKQTGGPEAFYNQTYDEKKWKRRGPSVTERAEQAAFARPTLSKHGAAAGIGDLTPTNLSEIIEREHGAGAEGKHVPPANQAGDAGVASMQKKMEALSGRGGIGGVNLAATSNERVLAHDKIGMEAKIGSMMNNIGAITADFGPGPDPFAEQPAVTHSVASVEPRHSVDVHDEMSKEYATNQPGSAKFTSPDLAKVASTNDAQVTLQTQMVHILGQLADHMAPDPNRGKGSDGGDPGDTSTNYVAGKPPMWGKWTTGKHAQQPGKGVLNVGGCQL
jgi:hypothetical protein